MSGLITRKRGKTWEYSFEIAKVDGKRKRVTKSGFRTKSEAVAAGTKAKAEYDSTGTVFNASTVSVADYMAYWLENYVRNHLAYESYRTYESVSRKHIVPKLGAYRLSALAPDAIQRWVDGLKAEGYPRGSISVFLAVLSGAISYAVYPCKFVAQNPCTHVRLPKIPATSEQKARTEFVCSKEDWERIESTFCGTDYYLPLEICYHTGMRVGECFGLDLLRDIDFKNHTLSINRQLRKVDGVWKYVNPKYDSIRTILIGPTLERIIRAEMTARKKDMLRYAEYYKKTYVGPEQVLIQLPADQEPPEGMREVWPIVRENGTIMNTAASDHMSILIRKKLGLDMFHMHCLRHTHGTILAENGASPKTIMERLGHKSIQVTMERYVTNTERMQEQAVSLFERAIK